MKSGVQLEKSVREVFRLGSIYLRYRILFSVPKKYTNSRGIYMILQWYRFITLVWYLGVASFCPPFFCSTDFLHWRLYFLAQTPLIITFYCILGYKLHKEYKIHSILYENGKKCPNETKEVYFNILQTSEGQVWNWVRPKKHTSLIWSIGWHPWWRIKIEYAGSLCDVMSCSCICHTPVI